MVHKSRFCLSYIFFTTLFASDAVNYVCTSTTDFSPSHVGSPSRVTGYSLWCHCCPIAKIVSEEKILKVLNI